MIYNNLNRVVYCWQIIGKKDQDTLNAAQIISSFMKCTDIYFLDIDIISLGME